MTKADPQTSSVCLHHTRLVTLHVGCSCVLFLASYPTGSVSESRALCLSHLFDPQLFPEYHAMTEFCETIPVVPVLFFVKSQSRDRRGCILRSVWIGDTISLFDFLPDSICSLKPDGTWYSPQSEKERGFWDACELRHLAFDRVRARPRLRTVVTGSNDRDAAGTRTCDVTSDCFPPVMQQE